MGDYIIAEEVSKIKDVDELLNYIEGNQRAVANDKKKAKKERQKQQKIEELRKREEAEKRIRDTGHGTRDTGHGTRQSSRSRTRKSRKGSTPRITPRGHTASHARHVTHDTDTEHGTRFPGWGITKDPFSQPPMSEPPTRQLNDSFIFWSTQPANFASAPYFGAPSPPR